MEETGSFSTNQYEVGLESIMIIITSLSSSAAANNQTQTNMNSLLIKYFTGLLIKTVRNSQMLLDVYMEFREKYLPFENSFDVRKMVKMLLKYALVVLACIIAANGIPVEGMYRLFIIKDFHR